MFYWLIIIALIPCVFYDWVTSLLGAIAIFGISNESSPVFWGIPIAISIGAVAMNFMTTDVMAKNGAPEWMKIFWFLCILFDLYTTFLGLVQVRFGGEFFSIKTTDLIYIYSSLKITESLAFVVAALVFVVSPMATFWLWKRSRPISIR